MIDPYLVLGVAIFLIGTILLSRTSAKRWIIFFMIRTKHGIRFVDRIANLSPGLWKFMGDLAIVVSFAGFGGYYVSRYRNTWIISAILGIVCLIFTQMSFGSLYALAGLAVLFFGVLVVRRSDRPFVHFLASAVIMGAIMFNIYPYFSDMEVFRVLISGLVGVFGVPALLISMLFVQASKIVIEQSTVPGVSPLLPTVGEQGPGFFFPGTGIFIPFWQALIAIICLLVPHEFAHGILTRSQNMKLKSMGILAVGPVPVGAFAEPDEKDMYKHGGKERMRMYAAGSFTNILTALIALILIVFVMSPFASSMTYPGGMLITNVVEGSPAEGVLEPGFVITEIGGKPTMDVEQFYVAIEGLEPGQAVEFVTSNGTFRLTLGDHPTKPGRGYIGIDLRETFETKEEYKSEKSFWVDFVLFTTPTLFWIFFICFNVALVNLLPVIPFDGGKMFEEYMQEFKISRRKRDFIQKSVIFIIIILLLVNASPLAGMLVA